MTTVLLSYGFYEIYIFLIISITTDTLHDDVCFGLRMRLLRLPSVYFRQLLLPHTPFRRLPTLLFIFLRVSSLLMHPDMAHFLYVKNKGYKLGLLEVLEINKLKNKHFALHFANF